MPFDGDSEEQIFKFIVHENPNKPDEKTMSDLSIQAVELFLHVGVKYRFR